MAKLAQALLWAVGLSLVGVGGAYLVAPGAMYRLYGASLEGVVAHHLVRTAFGGLHLAIGAAFVTGAIRPAARHGATWFLAVYLAGIVIGRTASLALDGLPPSPWLLPELAVEILLLALSLLALRRAD